MSFLALERLRKVYADGTEAVKGIDLTCGAGEFVVLLGPSGCGKTTTLRMIAGLEEVTGGVISVAGEEITGLPPGARDIGFVFQFYALYPHMKVRENIAFPLETIGVSKGELKRRVDDVVTRLGLGALSGFYPQQLSGGDQQRVALARAMIRRPQLYLMDEPLGTLDADLRLEMRELIRTQQLETGVTTIYVTHDQEEAMSLADRVVVMEGGEIRQNGPAGEVYDWPADLFVAHFIGSPGMNFVEGEVADGCFRAGELELTLPYPVRPGETILGVRPEFVHAAGERVLGGEVVMDEYMGSCRIVHLETACGRLVMRGGAEGALAAGGRIELNFDLKHLRFFDPQTGKGL